MNTKITGTGFIDGFQRSLHPYALDNSSLSIGRVKFRAVGYVLGRVSYSYVF